MPPDYHLEAFWTSRFKLEDRFEWLGEGLDTIIPVLSTFLRARKDNSIPGTFCELPQTLHIGAGTSMLSEHAISAYRDIYGRWQRDETIVVNTDFSEEAVRKGREMISTHGRGVQWKRVDLLAWGDIVKQLAHFKFAVVIDKSTSDAMSCGPNVQLKSPQPPKEMPLNHPLVASYLSRNQGAPLIFEPVELLALHLASLVSPGGLWIVLSYSGHRFAFLTTTAVENMSPPDVPYAFAFWRILRVVPVGAPSGQGKVGVHAPTVHHFMYVLERTEASCI